MNQVSFPHLSVLRQEILEFFSDISLCTFIDATLGAGGHSEAILLAHPELHELIGIDQDPTALQIAAERLKPFQSKIHLIQGNFEDLNSHLAKVPYQAINGFLLDLGVSSMQFDTPEKGFSFMHEGPLDMRMDPENPLTAEEIVNTWPEKELGFLFREYGEEPKWRRAAQLIVNARKNRPFRTTTELAEALRSLQPPYIKKGIHPATLVFQALRIRVNRELDVLETLLPQAFEMLSTGGRLGVISFHSLEDRIVKNFFRFKASDKYDTSGIGGLFLDKEPEAKILTKKPVIPSLKEIEANPRSRSAKLRFIEKL